MILKMIIEKQINDKNSEEGEIRDGNVSFFNIDKTYPL